MNKPKHTPGPWSGSRESINAPSGRLIAENMFIGTQEEFEANARLIAAAPDGLELAEEILAYAEAHGQFGLDFRDGQTLEDVLKAFIAKATGGDK
jgi:hypothetical protein